MSEYASRNAREIFEFSQWCGSIHKGGKRTSQIIFDIIGLSFDPYHNNGLNYNRERYALMKSMIYYNSNIIFYFV